MNLYWFTNNLLKIFYHFILVLIGRRLVLFYNLSVEEMTR